MSTEDDKLTVRKKCGIQEGRVSIQEVEDFWNTPPWWPEVDDLEFDEKLWTTSSFKFLTYFIVQSQETIVTL